MISQAQLEEVAERRKPKGTIRKRLEEKDERQTTVN
jgi:hypothetical protein